MRRTVAAIGTLLVASENCGAFLFCVVAEAQRRWQKGHCRGQPQALGQGESRSCHGGQGPTGTRRQESRQESAGGGFTEGRDEGCRQAHAESRRNSACCSGSDRLTLPIGDMLTRRSAVVTGSG